MEQKIKQIGWDRRSVDFSKAHGNEDDAFEKLIESMKLNNGITIGDIMSGYGAVSKKILEYCSNNSLFVRMVLIDSYQEQLDKSNLFLAPFDLQGYVIQREIMDARCLGLECKLDKAIIKMGLHEVPKGQQLSIVQGAYKSIKDYGELYVWESFGQNPKLTHNFRELVRKKDELAGYSSFVENRYFSDESEILEMLQKAGFREISVIYEGPFNYTTKNLLESDFLGDLSKLDAWNNYLRMTLPEEAKKVIGFNDEGDSISMKFVKKIFKAVK